ncbi:MAG TPA: hypothetical protein VEL07_13620 [Planctomycetota bacterium]|nr:hypothetical protein [Planctomycetota bacterium]
MTRSAFLVALVTVALPFSAYAADEIALSNRATRTFRVDAPPGRTLASVKLFVSADRGATWTLAQELLVPADTREPTRLRWTAPTDGVYGFVISSAYTDQQIEAEPEPGREPDVTIALDTAAPVIARFTAQAAADGATHVAWQADDPHPGPVRLEFAPAGSDRWALLTELDAAAGEIDLVLPVIVEATAITLRLVARDAAGNEATSAPTQVAPAPAPAVSDAVVAEPLPTASTTADLAAALADLPAAEVATAEPAQIAAPEPAPAIAAVAPPAEDEVLSGPGVDAAYHEKLAEDDTALAWAKGASPKEQTAASPVPERKPAYVPPAPRSFLRGAEAQAALTGARAALDEGRAVEALELYRQLRDSDLARVAAPEELRALAATGAGEDALAVAAALPPEARTDTVLLEHARLLRAAGRADDALRVAADVPRASPLADQAILLMAACLRDGGRVAQSRKLYQHLVTRRGPHADEAAAELAAMPVEEPPAKQ